MSRLYQRESAFPPCPLAKSSPAADRSAASEFQPLTSGSVPHPAVRPAEISFPHRRKPGDSDECASLPRLCCFRSLFNSAQNSAAHRAKNVWVAEQSRTPVSSHRERLNFECKLVDLISLPNLPGCRRPLCALPRTPEPLPH